MSFRPIDVNSLSRMLDARASIALLDVREPVEADRGHIFGMTSLPRSRLEFRIASLVPDRDTAIVVYCDGASGRAKLAAATLSALGYTSISWLDGGIAAWAQSGAALATGNNVPSKKFGEEVHRDARVPSIEAAALARQLQQGRRIAICDIRTPQEHVDACVPGAISIPSFDIALHAHDLSTKHDLVVLHCAGRTRGIIATRTLIELGLENVVALENGTIGWHLAGLELQRGAPANKYTPSATSTEFAERAARAMADEQNVKRMSSASLQAMLTEPSGNRYVFDVRNVDEFRTGHVPGSVALPGGQAVQRTDDFITLRNAPIVLIGKGEVQANLTAVWLGRMGCTDVSILAGGIDAWCGHGGELRAGTGRSEPLGWEAARASARFVTVRELKHLMADRADVLVVDVDYSKNYRRGHIPNALWLPRGWLEARIENVMPTRETPVVLTSADGMQSVYAAATLRAMGYTQAVCLEGGTQAWATAGLPVEKNTLEPQDDELLPPYQRGEQAMREYIRWETLLIV